MERENSVHVQKCAFRAYEGNQIAHFTTYSRTLRNNASVINVKTKRPHRHNCHAH